eukprot:TRINITY_DN26058_c0_g1_i1.p1 TRINITY_DN26058_c0_g1~~TRINITY_DN26058_c0_g1_i1.p1  ORF type:complete len:328 (-),score=32.88 TRINITY_DN26058_c0_g1_i1:117-1043(-)
MAAAPNAIQYYGLLLCLLQRPFALVTKNGVSAPQGLQLAELFRTEETRNAAMMAHNLNKCPKPRTLPPLIPERSCTFCQDTAQLWTMPQKGQVNTSIYFRNEVQDHVWLRWVDEYGVEHNRGRLDPGEKKGFHDVPEGQVTRAYATNGHLLLEHMAGKRVLASDAHYDVKKLADTLQAFVVEGASTEKDSVSHSHANSVNFTIINAKPLAGKMRWNEPEPSPTKADYDRALAADHYANYGFTNPLSVTMKLYWCEDSRCKNEKPLYEMKPGETTYELTFPGTHFVARTRDGQFLTELKAGFHGIVPSC